MTHDEGRRLRPLPHGTTPAVRASTCCMRAPATWGKSTPGRAKAFPCNQVITLFQEAALGGARPVPGGGTRRGPFCKRAADPLRRRAPSPCRSGRLRSAPPTSVLAKHLYHYDEAQVADVLEDPSIPATSHRAERALKTPIVSRKVWGGNRTEAGARARSRVLQSTLATCKQQAVSFHQIPAATVSCGLLGKLFKSRQRRNQGANQAPVFVVCWVSLEIPPGDGCWRKQILHSTPEIPRDFEFLRIFIRRRRSDFACLRTSSTA